MRVSSGKGARAVSSGAGWREIRVPGFPVEFGGFGELHAPFFTERRTRGLVQRCVAGKPVREMTKKYALTH